MAGRAAVIGGADHYVIGRTFIGRTERLTDLAVEFVDEVMKPRENGG